MKKVFLILILLSFWTNSQAQNYVRLLDKYGYEVKDTSKVGYTFFELIQGKGNVVLIHRFSKDSVKMQEKSFFFDSLENETGSSVKTFYASGKTKSMVRKDALKNQTLTKNFYETGVPKSEILQQGEEVITEKFFNNLGEEISRPELTPSSPKDGINGWNKYLSFKLTYPMDARWSRAEAEVILEFDIDKTGSIQNIRIVNLGESHPSLEKEAFRVIENYPYQWTPALENGIPVNTVMRVPIRFQLG